MLQDNFFFFGEFSLIFLKNFLLFFRSNEIVKHFEKEIFCSEILLLLSNYEDYG